MQDNYLPPLTSLIWNVVTYTVINRDHVVRLPVSTQGPIRTKLTYLKQTPRQSGVGHVLVNKELELDVTAADGLEVLRFQVCAASVDADDGGIR